MKIQHKLNLGFLTVSLFVILVGVIAVWANHQTIKHLELDQQHFLSMAKAANTATAISSRAKRAEGHLVLFLTLHDAGDRDKFFEHAAAVKDQIGILQKYVSDSENQALLDDIKTEEQHLLSRGQALLTSYDRERASTGSFSMKKHRPAVRSFHNASSTLRRQSVLLAKYLTSFLNRQAAITATTEVISYAKRAEGHLMLFLTLHDPIDRVKFFKRVASIEEQIRILQEHVFDPKGRQIIAAIKTWEAKLLSQGETLLKYYDQEQAATGSFSLEKYRAAILSFYDIVNHLRELGLKAEKQNIAFETQTRQTNIDSAQYFQIIIYVSIICAIILSLVLGYLISKKLTHPLKQLQHALTEVGKGRLNTAIDITSRDETRDLAEAFNAMANDLDKLKQLIEERNNNLKQEIEERKLVQLELAKALDEIKTLRGIIPICSNCKEIRDDDGIWNRLEEYIRKHSYAEFSHAICPKCAKELYPEYQIYDDEPKDA